MMRWCLVWMATLVACGSGGPGDLDGELGQGGGGGPSAPAPAAKTSASEKSGGSGGGGTTGTSSTVGPKCTAYLACCDAAASANPAMGQGCDAARTQIDAAREKGASTSSFESSCDTALSSMKSAGLCR